MIFNNFSSILLLIFPLVDPILNHNQTKCFFLNSLNNLYLNSEIHSDVVDLELSAESAEQAMNIEALCIYIYDD